MKRTYLIVGASGAIGSAVARKLAAPETALGLHYCRNRTGAEEVSRECSSAETVLLESPLRTEADCRALWQDARYRLGPLDGVALCAGRVPWKPWDALIKDDWEDALFEHCVGPVTIARAAIEDMRVQGGGAIVFLSSVAPKYGGSSRTLHYAAAKAAVETCMRGLARLEAHTPVRINCVRSGVVLSPQQRGRSEQEIAERVAKIPMGRAGRPDEVAAAICFLLSQESSFVTGEILTAAGGD